jgi:hypothetical protein
MIRNAELSTIMTTSSHHVRPFPTRLSVARYLSTTTNRHQLDQHTSKCTADIPCTPVVASLCAALAESTKGSASLNQTGGTSTSAVARDKGRGPGIRRGSAAVSAPDTLLSGVQGTWDGSSEGAARRPKSPNGLACSTRCMWQVAQLHINSVAEVSGCVMPWNACLRQARHSPKLCGGHCAAAP